MHVLNIGFLLSSTRRFHFASDLGKPAYMSDRQAICKADESELLNTGWLNTTNTLFLCSKPGLNRVETVKYFNLHATML